MKRNVFSFMLALLTIGAMLVSGCKKYDDDISDLNKRIADLETSASSLDQAVKTAQTAAVAAQSAADAAGAAAVAAGAAVVTVGEAAEKAQGTADQAILDAAAAEAEAVAAQATADQALALATAAATKTEVEMYAKMAKEAHSFLDSLINDNEKAIEANLARIVSLNAGLNGALKRIATLENNVTALENTVKTHGDQIEALFAKVTAESTALGKALVGVKDDLKKLADDNADAHQKFEDAIKDLNDGLTQTNAQLVSVEAALTAKIETLSATVEGLIKDVLDTISVERTRIDELYTTTEVLWFYISMLDTTQKGDFKACMEQVAANKAEIEKLKGSVAELQAGLDTLTKELAAEVARAKGEENAIKEAYAAADAKLQASIDALAYAQKGLEDQIKEVNKALADYKAVVEKKLSDLKADLEDKIKAHEAEVSEEINALKEAVKALQDADKNLGSRIDNLEKAIEGKLIVVTEYAGKMLTGIVFRPQYYINGVPGVIFMGAKAVSNSILEYDTYKEYTVSGKNVWSAEPIDISFDMNPYNAGIKADDIEVAATEISEVENFYRYDTKANEKTNVITVTGKKVENGKLIVSLKLNNPYPFNPKIGNAAERTKTPIFQIKVTSGKGDSARTITSENIACELGTKYDLTDEDMAVYTEEGTNQRSPRTAIMVPSIGGNNVSQPDYWGAASVQDHAQWHIGTNIDSLFAGRDTILSYDGKDGGLDLNKKFKVGCWKNAKYNALSKDQMDSIGLFFSFEKMEKYKFDGVKQWDYATLNDGVLMPDTDKGEAVIGKSPLVRVTLYMKNGGITNYPVYVCYYRPFFVRNETKTAKEMKLLDDKGNETPYSKWNQQTESRSVGKTQIEALYTELGMTATEFRDYYMQEGPSIGFDFGKITCVKDVNGCLTDITDTLSAIDIWNHPGKEVTGTVTFCHREKHDMVYLNVPFRGSIATFDKTVTVLGKEEAFWSEDITEYRLPDGKGSDYDSDKCEISSSINASFIKDTEGYIKFKSSELANRVQEISYTYDALQGYSFSGSFVDVTNPQSLKGHTVTYKKNDSKAQDCIRNDYAYAKVTADAVAMIGDGTLVSVKVKFPTADSTYFKAHFIRPLVVNITTPTKQFNANKPSTFNVGELVAPSAWDGVSFDPSTFNYNNRADNLWKFYGVSGNAGFSVDVDPSETSSSWSKYGTLTYDGKQTLTFVPDTKVLLYDTTIQVQVHVYNGWGEWKQIVTIPVKK